MIAQAIPTRHTRRRAGASDTYSFYQALEGVRADYEMARESRFVRRRQGISPIGASADYHIRNEAAYFRMVETARDMRRNDSIVGPAVERAVSNIVQEGFKLRPQTGDPGLDIELSERWREWASDPDQSDLAGEHSFHDIERIALDSQMTDGDVFELPTEDGSLQMIEAHRCRTSQRTTRNVIHGVLLDEFRRRQEYWFTKDDIDPFRPINLRDMTRNPARDDDGNRLVFHIYRPDRISMTRGVTALAPVAGLAGMFEDTMFARMLQQQVISCFTIFRQLDANAPPDESDSQYGDRETATLSDGATRFIEGVAPAMEVAGKRGEKLTGFSPNVPNPEFFPFIRVILTFIGINLGVPLVVMLMDASETNFSGWRGAVDQARIGFRCRQQDLVARLHTPTYLWKLRNWSDTRSKDYDPALGKMIRKSEVGLPKLFRHRWNTPRWPYLEPLKEWTTNLLRARNGLGSLQTLFAESMAAEADDEVQEIMSERERYILTAKRKAAKINKQFPDDDPVTWQQIFPLPMPEGLQINITEQAPGEKAAQPTEGAAQPTEGAFA